MVVTPTDRHLFQPTLKEKEKQRAVLVSIGLNLVFTVIEFVVGIKSGSVALISDAVHDLGDSLGLSVTYLAQRMFLKPPTTEKSFGNLRITILAAFFNSLLLFGITIFIFIEAFKKIQHPETVSGIPLISVAVLGFVFNGIATYLLFKKREDIDTRSLFYHILEDSLGWLAVLIAGLVIVFTGFYIIDPIISFLIGLIVLYGAYEVTKETIAIFLEGTPKGINADIMAEKMLVKFKEIDSIHDIHIWVLGPGRFALSAHIAVDDMEISESRLLLNRIKNFLREEFNIWHTSMELECPSCISPWSSRDKGIMV